MATVVGLTLVKSFTYRGDTTEEYSNQYWLTGAVPADYAAWKALATEVATEEAKIYPSDTKMIRAYGYSDDSPTATSVWTHDYVSTSDWTPGTLSAPGLPQAPGDVAVWVRWKTSRLNTRGKAIYLRKYFHPAVLKTPSAANRDSVSNEQLAALDAFGTKMMNGTLSSGRKIRSQGHDEVILMRSSSIYATTRTLKRRGKRPNS